MDPIKELRELKARLSTIVTSVKAENRDLTPDELNTLEEGNSRLILLKAAVERGQKNADVLARLGDLGGATSTEFPNGIDGVSFTRHEERKGFLTPASLKATAAAASSRDFKSLVAEGSTATPIALDTKPVTKGENGFGLLSYIETRARGTRSYSHLTQTVRQNNADKVAPGATKPVSVYTVAEVQNTLDVVAHTSEPIDKYLLLDNEDLQAFLENEMRNGIIRKVTSLAVSDILGTSGIRTQAFSGSAADSLYLAKSTLRDFGYTASVIVLPNETYNSIRLLKDADGRYILGDSAFFGDDFALWGVPTLTSPDVPAGTALVLGQGAVNLSTDKQGMEVAWDPYTGFTKNQVTARVEARFATDVVLPEAVVKVSTAA
ncbi:phage major capsid protein [Curtobacterium sp. 'Ferrero']|uniref:phage major capsid protein n=1 Tax=Curtobacterium sp. 'Ferrero' TaxID=2033654 RepID=UPI000BC9FDA5|nr:phage major capsid protein [Curtobacterium sp. 'Ferrero']PCN47409.1 phage major capsid protein [Curtobacterium sp. 'Ferrero']